MFGIRRHRAAQVMLWNSSCKWKLKGHIIDRAKAERCCEIWNQCLRVRNTNISYQVYWAYFSFCQCFRGILHSLFKFCIFLMFCFQNRCKAYFCTFHQSPLVMFHPLTVERGFDWWFLLSCYTCGEYLSGFSVRSFPHKKGWELKITFFTNLWQTLSLWLWLQIVNVSFSVTLLLLNMYTFWFLGFLFFPLFRQSVCSSCRCTSRLQIHEKLELSTCENKSVALLLGTQTTTLSAALPDRTQ